jgi:hypothetical protein
MKQQTANSKQQTANSIKCFTLVFLIGFLLLFTNCQKDDTTSTDTRFEIEQESMSKFKLLKGNEIPKSVTQYLKQTTNNTMQFNLSGKQIVPITYDTRFSRDTLEIGTVDTSKSQMVVNDNNTKYTFVMINNDATSLHNLVVVDMNGTIINYYIKYTPDATWAQTHTMSKDMHTYTGTITFYNKNGIENGTLQLINGVLDDNGSDDVVGNPCDDPENVLPPDPDGTNTGGGGNPYGNGNTDDGSNTNSDGGSDNGGADDSPSCTYTMGMECTGGGHHTTPDAAGCYANDGWSITFTMPCPPGYGKNTNVQGRELPEDPCAGDVGLLVPDYLDLISLIEDCLNLDEQNQSSSIAVWFYNTATYQQKVDVGHYIQESGCNESTVSFMELAILAFDNENIVDFELEMIVEVNETQEFKEQTCLKKIKDDVIKIKEISRIIKRFEPTSPVLNLEWGIFNDTDWNNTGQTSLDSYQTTAFIEFNSESLIHVNNIVMVKTIAHEIIHAELFRKLKELVDDYQILSLSEYLALQDNFLGIADFTFRYGQLEYSQSLSGNLITWGLVPDYSLAHHNQMASYYRETLIKVMKAYDNVKGITRPNAEEFYEALSWAGLMATSNDNGENAQYTDAWKNFKDQIDIDEADIPVVQRTYNRYIDIIDEMYESNGINCN